MRKQASILNRDLNLDPDCNPQSTNRTGRRLSSSMHFPLMPKKIVRKSPALLVLSGWLVAAVTFTFSTQAALLSKSGSEYRFLPSLPGDQVNVQTSFGPEGGFLVTQDNSIDGNGLGIRARRYYADLSAAQSTFQVNSVGAADQQNPRVALLNGGGAVFTWQSSTAAGNRIFVRFMNAEDTFINAEIPASDIMTGHQSDAAVAVLTDGTVVVVWVEADREAVQSDIPRMNGIFAQRFSSVGARIGATFQVNERADYDQRSPTVAALANGTFVVAWVSDDQRIARPDDSTIDIYARIFSSQAQAAGPDFRLNSSDNVCANPALIPMSSGFRAAWSGRSLRSRIESWDVETRSFNFQGSALGTEVVVNNTTRGDQFAPKLASFGNGQIVVWTSFGQDGADEGVYARTLTDTGFDGAEFLVNTRTRSRQIFPAVSAAGQKVVITWSSFVGGLASFDVFAQDYLTGGDLTLPPLSTPFACGVDQTTICVTWPEILSQRVSYLVYLDQETSATETTGGIVTLSRAHWTPGSTHTVRVAYRTQDGKISPLSEAVTVKTWGLDGNGDGLPDDWQTINWGKGRPGADIDSDFDGATNLQEFLAGTDPTDPNSVLRLKMNSREQGLYIEWSTEAGNYYQLQATSDFKTWRNANPPRFAPSSGDAVPVTTPDQVHYYRVIRMR
jgi:hypothetical protein